MRYKKSFYNIEMKVNDYLILYNTLTKAFAELDEDTQSLYEAIEDDINNENNSVKILEENGFIVDKNIDEHKRVEVIRNIEQFSSSIFSLTIAPTLNCNMRCPYCYEDKRNVSMSELTATKLVQFVRAFISSKKYKIFTVIWYGGEPLLEKDTIKKLSKEFVNICNEFNVKYEANIITNGSLLDYDTGLMLRDICKVAKVQVTLDGLKETNNSRRLLKNGKDSFSIITENVNKCKSFFKFSIRINVDKTNINEVNMLVNNLNEYFNYDSNIKIYFSPVLSKTDSCKNIERQCYTAEEFSKYEAKLFNKQIIDSKKNNYDNLFLDFGSMTCGANNINSFVIDPDGYLYKCWQQIGLVEKNVGNVADGIDINNNYINWMSIKIPDKCTGCKYFPQCGGGCAYDLLNNNVVCDFKIYAIKEKLKNIYKIYYAKEERKVNE